RTDLKEFIDGTNPTIVDLRALEDIIAVVKGQSISFNPTENDISNLENITVSNIESPAAGLLVDNLDGTYAYTATSDRLGWLRLTYTANDGESDAVGEIFIHIVEQAPAQVVRVDSSDSGSHSMALFDDGSVYTWGGNGSGQLGLGTTINNYVPTRVGGLPKIKDFALGSYYTLALDVDGAVWYWGNSVTVPMAIPLSEGMVIDDIAASYSYIYLLDSNGNIYTEYADSSPTLPSQIAGFSNISEINSGQSHLLALDNNGLVWASGNNRYGQLGYGQDTGSSSVPVQVSKISSIVSIEAGSNYSFAIDDQGQLFAWGDNNYGQLGDETYLNRNVPVEVATLSNVAEVKAGNNHTLVRTIDGSLYGMGYGSSYALGSVDEYRISTPKLIMDESVSAIGAGNNSSFVIGTDGLSYSFGANSSGRLGDGTTESHSEAVEISWLLDGVISELGKEGFEWGRIPPYWRNSGSNWQVTQDVSNSGSFSARVKDRLNDNASASLGLQIATGAGDVNFSIKTSSEADYDELIFYIDGVEQARYSGENDWLDSVAISIDAGVHSFEWIYHKDGGTSVGEDTVWLDDIQLPVDSDGDGIIDAIDPEPYIPAAPE
ncbi:MAG: cadherin-like domain-containing protein, partial [Cycloclasticus sp.]